MVITKKGYLRTLEVMLALVLTFAFVIYMLPTPEAQNQENYQDIIIKLSKINSFRNDCMNLTQCLYKGENTSITNLLDYRLTGLSGYVICPSGDIPELPRKKVTVESYLYAGNITNSTIKIIKLYYWE